ncbi:hypothetical protein [Paracoccus aeridis]|uniref:hypothetical protein n=1 Tax=Paracoccus aeridis TaxID=1966466 RepID=UPI0010A9CB0A|nr:hypothetical protein [Paracoccus aeridis]
MSKEKHIERIWIASGTIIALGSVATAVIGRPPKPEDINDALVTNSVLAALAIPGILFLTALLIFDIVQLFIITKQATTNSSNQASESFFEEVVSFLAGGYGALWGCICFLFLSTATFAPGAVLRFTRSFFSSPSNVVMLLGAAFLSSAIIICRWGGKLATFERGFLAFLTTIGVLSISLGFVAKWSGG